MQNGGDAQYEFVARFQRVQMLQFAEQLLGKVGDVIGMLAVGLVADADFTRSLHDFFLKSRCARSGNDEILHQFTLKIAIWNPEKIITKAAREGEVGLKSGHDAFSSRVMHMQLAHEFIRVQQGQLFCEALQVIFIHPAGTLFRLDDLLGDALNLCADGHVIVHFVA